jgi:hypothetical protein
MKARIKDLLDKYWDAETTLEEEKELRDLLRKATGFEMEKALFESLGQFKSEEPKNLILPKAKTKKLNLTWVSWAASVTLLIGTFYGWKVYEQKQAEKQAYEQVMQALSLIQTNLNRGQQELQPLNDLKYLNAPDQVFHLSKPNEQ